MLVTYRILELAFWTTRASKMRGLFDALAGIMTHAQPERGGYCEAATVISRWLADILRSCAPYGRACADLGLLPDIGTRFLDDARDTAAVTLTNKKSPNVTQFSLNQIYDRWRTGIAASVAVLSGAPLMATNHSPVVPTGRSAHSEGAARRHNMKARQTSKIRELGEALVASGLRTLDEQAKALGLPRSTTWTILRANHKASGLSATVINQTLSAPQLPPLVRATIL
jgi:hypothetical protein